MSQRERREIEFNEILCRWGFGIGTGVCLLSLLVLPPTPFMILTTVGCAFTFGLCMGLHARTP